MQRDQGVQGRLFGADEEGTAPGAGASPTPPAGGDATRELGELTQPEGEVAFDGQHTYTYTGYVLEGVRYVQKRFRFTCDELDIYPGEELGRICAMVDRVGRDPARQAEIKRFGKRAWHSPYRPEDAAAQGLDYIFRHDADLVAACSPYVAALYGGDEALADRWTMACYDAYRAFALHRQHAPLLRLLQEAGIPPQVVLLPLP